MKPWHWVAGKLAKRLAVTAQLADGSLEPFPITGKSTLRHAAAKWKAQGFVLRAGDDELIVPPEEGEAPKEAGNPSMGDVHVPSTDRRSMRLVKAETTQQKVVGVVFEPDVVDTQGDMVAAPEIEAACHQFLADYRAGKTELWRDHETQLTDDDAVLVENYISPTEAVIGGQTIKAGAWLQVWHIKSAMLWQMVLGGLFTGFSFGGTGVRKVAKSNGPPIAFERDGDGLAEIIMTPAGRYRVLRDDRKVVLGMEKTA